MTVLNLTSFDAALKEHYTPQRVKMLSYEDRPLLGLLPKYTKFGGKVLPIPIQFANPNKRSRVASNVYGSTTNAFPGQVEDFRLTRARDYGSVFISNEVLEASQGDANAFMEARTFEIDGMLNKLSNSLAISLYGDSVGAYATIGTYTAGPPATILLGNPDDVARFEVNDMLTITQNADGTGVRGGTDLTPVRITAVDRDSGTLTLSGTVASASSGDSIFIHGEINASIAGLRAWLPDSAPGSSLFFGVDRSVDTTRLGGVRFDGTSMTIEEALIAAGARLVREGGNPSHVFMNPTDVASLVMALGSKVVYDKVQSPDEASIGFEAVKLMLPTGRVAVVPDRFCPKGRAYMLTMSTWKIYSLGQAPRVWDTDGQRMLRMPTADGIEIRGLYYAQLGCTAPGWNATISLG